MIRHIVMWKFKEGPDKEENIETFRKGLLSLTDCVPGILSMQFGKQMKENDRNCDAVLLMDFADETALRNYLQHPEHKKVSAFCKSSRESRHAVDFWVEERE